MEFGEEEVFLVNMFRWASGVRWVEMVEFMGCLFFFQRGVGEVERVGGIVEFRKYVRFLGVID